MAALVVSARRGENIIQLGSWLLRGGNSTRIQEDFLQIIWPSKASIPLLIGPLRAGKLYEIHGNVSFGFRAAMDTV